jgi:hypothetical protein
MYAIPSLGSSTAWQCGQVTFSDWRMASSERERCRAITTTRFSSARRVIAGQTELDGLGPEVAEFSLGGLPTQGKHVVLFRSPVS